MYARPKKECHLDTIRYEIDMLRFCEERLRANEGNWRDEGDSNAFLEAFLVHYRNLIEFLADHGEIRLTEPELWAGRAVSNKDLLRLKNVALYRKWRSPISRYLQHITRIRAEMDRGWPVDQMYGQIEPCIKTFERLLPRIKGQERIVSPSSPLGDAHTATIVRTG